MGDQSTGMGRMSADVVVQHVYRILADTNGTFSNPPNPLGPTFNAKFNPSMAIIIIVLISAFLFMGFFSIYVRRCTRTGQLGGFEAARLANRDAVASASVRQVQGLDQAVVDALPLVGYSLVKGLKGGKELSECAVCLSDFEDDENLRLLPKCGHVFHPDCIDMWFHSHSTCPLCRASLVPSPGKDVNEEDNSPEEPLNWITSRGIGPDGEAFTIHEGPPVPPNGSILELLSREGAERVLAESVRLTGERAERLDAGLARREGEDGNVERAAGIRALNRALSKNSASFRNAARGSDASGRIDAVSGSSDRFNSASVSISIPDLNDMGSKSFGSSQSFNTMLRRSSSTGSSGRYISQLLGLHGYNNYTRDELGMNQFRLDQQAKREFLAENPTLKRERSASELRNISIPTWQDIDLNAPSSARGERDANGWALPSPTTRPGVLPFERWAKGSRKYWSGELSGTNNDAKSGEDRRKETEPVVEERTKSDRWSSIGQSFRRTFSLKRPTTSVASDVENSSQPGASSASKPKKFSPWTGASKIRRQSSNSGDLPSPRSVPSMTFPPSSEFPQSYAVDSPRSLPPDSVFPPFHFVGNEQQQQNQRQQPPKEDSSHSETQP